MLNDDGVYLLLSGIYSQALKDSQNPNTNCEHRPHAHMYKDCAVPFVEELQNLSSRNPITLGLEIIKRRVISSSSFVAEEPE